MSKIKISRRSRAFFLLCGFAFISFPVCAAGQAALELSAAASEVTLGADFDYLRDIDRRFDFEAVHTGSTPVNFIPAESDTLQFGQSLSGYWLKLRLNYQTIDYRHWLLVLDRSRYERLAVYMPDDKGGFQKFELRYNDFIAEPRFSHHRFVFDLPSSLTADMPVYLYLENKGTINPNITIWEASAFQKQDHSFQVFFTVIYTVLGLMVLINSIFFLVLRDKAYLYYVLYMSTFLTYLLYQDGKLYEFYWPAKLSWGVQGMVFVASLAAYFAAKFNQEFVNLKLAAPRMDRAITFFRNVLLVIVVLTVFDINAIDLPIVTAANITYLIVGPLMLSATFIAWLQGSRAATFFLVAWSILLTMTLYRTMSVFGVVEQSTFALYAFQVGAALEAVILSIGLADRVLEFRKQRDKASDLRQQASDQLRIERARRQFADGVNRFLHSLDPTMYEKAIVTRFLSSLSEVIPFKAADVVVAQHGKQKLVQTGGDELPIFATALEKQASQLRSICIANQATVINIYSDAAQHMESIGVIPVPVKENEWACILLQPFEGRIFNSNELLSAQEFAEEAYEALQNAAAFKTIRRRADMDGLTNIYNRRAITERMHREFDKARLTAQGLAVLFIDIDFFKRVNDHYSHAAGDEALKIVAGICQENLRGGDYIGRYGGEEFVSILPGADESVAEHVGERIRQAVETTPLDIGEHRISVTLSVGIAAMHENFNDADALLHAADTALYEAKHAGRNCVVTHRQTDTKQSLAGS
ncbi:MAG: sensor domain-containing diguanylate cyclase [Gammaproteobacteria bacterium]|nr:sensor domain-containing diguanylate cyclase [Gammaproteobacteria bacterium]